MAAAAGAPVRKWYYLNGYFRNHTTDPVYPLNLPNQFCESWLTYAPNIEFQLNQSVDDLKREGAAEGKLLDLSMFTENLEYEIWKGREFIVLNQAAPEHLRGKPAVAGFPVAFWNDIADDSRLLPKAVATWVDMGVGKVVAGFYQIHSQSIGLLEEQVRFLQDATGNTPPPSTPPRKRIVLLVEMPPGWHDVKKCDPMRAPEVSGARAMEDGAEPVYEWWFGDRGPEKEMNGTRPHGFWKKYHPKVCKKLEQAFNENADFKQGVVAGDVDGVRYMIHHILDDKRFDYQGQASIDPFTEDHCITTQHPCYDQVDRLTGNCFVQFAKGNPARRRPARRVLNAEDMARNAVRTGEPCSVCFSEDGDMTGCPEGHVVCPSCLRTGLRILSGDIYSNTNLICGCFSYKNRRAIMVLAERADTSMQEALATEPANKYEKMERDMEIQDCRQRFQLGDDGDIPRQLYMIKIGAWFEKVLRMQVAPEYYVCSHPDCAAKVENWMKREEFDAEYRDRGIVEWTCPAGHHNTVLPGEDEIREYNRIILVHPEYYIQSCSYSSCALRRRRFCKECVAQGILMIAEHSDACKHWPGDGRSHRHQFCFACSGTWGSECRHGNDCTDPGIQQVRRQGDSLEIGFVNGQEYLRWLQNEIPEPPPTIFQKEPKTVAGAERQRDLGMEDKAELLKESRSGTR